LLPPGLYGVNIAMTVEDLNSMLQDLLERHGIDVVHRDGWLWTSDNYPALRGKWFPDPEAAGRLDVQVALGDGRTIEECFAGVGDGKAALHDALRNFCMSSLHVLLAAVWNHLEEDQVDLDDWRVGTSTWQVYVGGFVHRTSTHPDIDYPENAFEVIAAAAKREALAPGLHWIRTFFCAVGDKEEIVEVLLDNEPWEAGAEAYRKLEWQKDKGYYSLRNFFAVQVPTAPAKQTGLLSRLAVLLGARAETP
jgi:hypothetical protein